ncbi:MAG: hypothetical protein RLZZ625_389 [Pseudomonadota bacterium]
MKLVTTYAGLQLLGPQFQWKTEVLYKGAIKNKHLYGNLIIKAYGDPTLTYADLSEIIEKVQQQGILHIHGNVIFDESFYFINTTTKVVKVFISYLWISRNQRPHFLRKPIKLFWSNLSSH